MLELAVEDSHWICVSDWEIMQPQYSCTLHVLENKKNQVIQII
jgi:nicotinic acid mononucleotide adenylyltransferase